LTLRHAGRMSGLLRARPKRDSFLRGMGDSKNAQNIHVGGLYRDAGSIGLLENQG
jgi:hypothetical protein